LYYVATASIVQSGRGEGSTAMWIDIIDWDDEDDTEGNLWHIIGPER
jgi:hypothetical protein